MPVMKRGQEKIPLSLIKEMSAFYEVSADHLLRSGDENDSDGITLAAHRTDGYDTDLPEEAKQELNSYIEFLKMKYKKKD